jgi:uncharacterized membrane protein
MLMVKARHNGLELIEFFDWFLIYSHIGWIYETAFCFMSSGYFIKRGFLFGPICPIYGICIVLMICLHTHRRSNMFSLFFYCAFISTVFEYMVSYGMEIMFCRRWWDYSDKIFNINGRICIGATLLFGMGGAFIARYVHPVLTHNFRRYFTYCTVKKISIAVLAIFVFDIMLSLKRAFG